MKIVIAAVVIAVIIVVAAAHGIFGASAQEKADAIEAKVKKLKEKADKLRAAK